MRSTPSSNSRLFMMPIFLMLMPLKAKRLASTVINTARLIGNIDNTRGNPCGFWHRAVWVNPCNSLNPGNNQSSFENCPLQLFREAYGNWLHTGPWVRAAVFCWTHICFPITTGELACQRPSRKPPQLVFMVSFSESICSIRLTREYAIICGRWLMAAVVRSCSL